MIPLLPESSAFPPVRSMLAKGVDVGRCHVMSMGFCGSELDSSLQNMQWSWAFVTFLLALCKTWGRISLKEDNTYGARDETYFLF